MMNFLPLCKAIIQHQRVNKGGYRFGIKNRKADCSIAADGFTTSLLPPRGKT